ncbi:hypothetical protein APSETT445_001665 [Aspergillus pseudonomiae]
MEVRRQSGNGHATYQRTYKACLACRQRKAKCELGTGPDGLPLGPPCAKCRREQRECVFSEKKAWERQKKRGHGPSPLSYAEQDQDNADSTTLQSSPAEGSQRRRQSTSTLANSMMRTVVSSGNDALNILFEAAAAHSKEHGNGLSESSTPSRNARSSTGRSNNYDNSLNQSIVPPEVLAKAAQPVEISQASKDVLSVWGACRFVRMGWFTAREAVTFIDLFFKNMSDLSPILTDFYADHKNHRWLVSHDPVLCCTILMISSRYHLLPGAGGGSRNFFIHHRLWQHCQQLVMRLMFGQEKSSQSKVRNIGTIEALMLMSEWHPRSLHFPPESDGWDFDLTSVPPDPQELEDSSSTNRWLEDMIEPARRSDQMSWMLLGSALSLAHELGIFELDEKKLGYASGYEGFISGEQIKLRRQRVQRLLYYFDILFLEYHFVRVYTHSVGMQAVVERVLADSDPHAEEVRALNIDPIDYEYIQEVIDGCCQILQKVIQLAENGVLRFCPVRIFLRITSSSIFLMKALSLGTRQSTLRESLDVLERSIQALRSNALDDIHLSTRYAALLDMHVARLRRNLLASSKTVKSNQGTTSKPSMGVPSSTNQGNNTPMMDIPISQNMSDMGYIPSLNDIAADDWLSLPFDPSMAPFGISSAGQFPAYEGGALNFIWNLPS